MPFLGMFVMCLIGIYLYVLFCSVNVWLLMIGSALILAGFLTAYMNLAERVEKLEKRLQEMEGEDSELNIDISE